MTYSVNAGTTTAKSHNFYTYDNANNQTNPLTIQSSQNISRVPLTLYNGVGIQNTTLQMLGNTTQIVCNTDNSGIQFLSRTTANITAFIVNPTNCVVGVNTLDFSFSGPINLTSTNIATNALNMFTALTTNTVNFFTSLVSGGIVNMGAVASTSLFNLNSRLTHRQTQKVNEVSTISGTSATLTFPLEQKIMLTSTGVTNINITLPTITASYQAGFEFVFIKTGSITNSVIFTAGAVIKYCRMGLLQIQLHIQLWLGP